MVTRADKKGKCLSAVGRPLFLRSALFFQALLLWPLSFLYGAFLRLRNQLYDFGILPEFKIAASVIAVGNLSVGGSGKTPLVREIANWALLRGLRPVILTRGYRSGLRNPTRVELSGDRFYGDEPRMLKEMCPQSEVVISPDRVRGARWAIENQLGNLFILDDGFQHRRIARDLNILVVDATETERDHYPVPFGRGREWATGRDRASALVFSKSNLGATFRQMPNWIWEWKWRAGHHKQKCFNVDYELAWPPELNQAVGILIVSALARPESFEEMVRAKLSQLGSVAQVRSMAFADHHRYAITDVHAIRHEMSEMSLHGKTCLVTTQKDAGKLSQFQDVLPGLHVLELILRIPEKGRFYEFLDQVRI